MRQLHSCSTFKLHNRFQAGRRFGISGIVAAHRHENEQKENENNENQAFHYVLPTQPLIVNPGFPFNSRPGNYHKPLLQVMIIRSHLAVNALVAALVAENNDPRYHCIRRSHYAKNNEGCDFAGKQCS